MANFGSPRPRKRQSGRHRKDRQKLLSGFRLVPRTTAATLFGTLGRLHRGRPGVTQTRVIRSEWIKFASLRSAVITLFGSAAALVGIGLLASGMSSGTLATPADGGPPLTADPTSLTLTGTNLAQLIVGALGVLLVTSEYSSGLIRSSLGAVPSRLPVLWAKAVVLALACLALLIPAVLGAFLGGQALLS